MFLVLKVTIATLLEILCTGAYISSKLFFYTNSGISSRFSRKLWCNHCGRTLGSHAHFNAVPLLEAEICQNPGLGEDAQLASLERASLPGLTETVDFQAMVWACLGAVWMLWRDLSIRIGGGMWRIQLVANILNLWCCSVITDDAH